MPYPDTWISQKFLLFKVQSPSCGYFHPVTSQPHGLYPSTRQYVKLALMKPTKQNQKNKTTQPDKKRRVHIQLTKNHVFQIVCMLSYLQKSLPLVTPQPCTKSVQN